MKTTSTASALALSGLLLGLPMAQGRGVGGGPKLGLFHGDSGKLSFAPPKAQENSVGPVGLNAPHNGSTLGQALSRVQGNTLDINDLRKTGVDNTGEEKAAFAVPGKDEEPGSSGGVEVEGRPEDVNDMGDPLGAPAKEDVPDTRAGGIPGFGGLSLDIPNRPGAGEDSPGNGGDNPGNGGDDPENPGVDSVEAVEGEDEDGMKTISFYCDLKIDFFEDQGKAPTEDEVQELIHTTDDWLSEVFEIDPTFVYIKDAKTTVVYDDDAKDYFYVEFSSVVHANHENSELWKLNIYDIAAMVDHADYEVYITHFIWEGSPELEREEYQFYQTQQVTLGCWRGDRPAAEERRRLRGKAIEEPLFGGSHRVVREN